MIVLKKNHYVLMLAILAFAVMIAAWKNVKSEPQHGIVELSTESVQSTAESDTAALTAAEPETAEDAALIGVWIPYMSLIADGTEVGFKENFDAKLAAAQAAGATAVFVHVRPFADSLYPSEYEPWSHILTGTQGQEPGYDPLEYMIEKTHAAGIEFHAWINPLRISTGSTPAELSGDSFYMENREIYPYYFMEYDGGIYYNPASSVVRERIADSAAEIAENYDVDGIHFDDYFYPSGDEEIDSTMYKAYVNNTEEPLPLHEWRTANISALIASVYRKIKKVDENIVFGISPQGNLANNEKINADVYTWCAQKGYIDYICPQLYYSFENAALPFETALAEWTEMPRLENIELYIGLAVYKAGTDADDGTWLSREDTIARQIERAKESGADGVILYAVDHLGNDAAQAEMANAEIVIDAWIE